MSPEEVAGTGGSKPPKVGLGEVIGKARKEAKYYVHPELGFAGLFVEVAQRLAGIATRKRSLSQYQESLVLEEAVRLAGGPIVNWERYKGNYRGISLNQQIAASIRENLIVGIRAYLERIRELEKIGETSYSDAVKYAKAKMAGR